MDVRNQRVLMRLKLCIYDLLTPHVCCSPLGVSPHLTSFKFHYYLSVTPTSFRDRATLSLAFQFPPLCAHLPGGPSASRWSAVSPYLARLAQNREGIYGTAEQHQLVAVGPARDPLFPGTLDSEGP